MRVWVARPEPGATRTAAALAALGHAPLVAPILAVRPTGARPPDSRFDALLLTSVNAVPALREIPALPVFAVGARTAVRAAEAGLGPVHEGPGDAAGLAALVRRILPPGARLLHAAGAERKPEPAATLTAAGFRVTTFVAYAAEALPALPDPVDRALAGGNLDAVLHYSRRSAAIAFALAEDAGHGGAFRRLKHYCLSADVAAPLEAAGVPVHFVAARPREAELLDALAPPPGPACGDREAGPPHLALAPGAGAVLGGRGRAEELEDLPVTPPPSDADKPGPGGRRPDPTPAKPGQATPSGGETRPAAAQTGATGGAKPGSSAPQTTGVPPKPATEPIVAAKPDPKADPLKAEAAGTVPPGKPEAGKPEAGKPEAGKPEAGKAEPPKPGSASTASSASSTASSASTASATAGGRIEPGRPDPARTEPPKPGQPGSGPQGSPRPGGAATGAAGTVAAGTVTAGPIIDMKAKRIPEAATTGKEPPKEASKEQPKESVRGPVPGVAASTGAAPAAPATRGRAGFGSLAAAGLLGGVIGAGLLFGAEKGGIGPDPRLNALDQKLSGQIAALGTRLDGLAPRDAVTALDKRVATAESTAKQALDKAASAPAPAAAEGASSGQAPTVPADLTARLDSLDQRVAALQEEPGRDQPAESKLNAVQDSGKQIADLESRLKALEAKGGDADSGQKLAALQSEVEQKTQANAAADAALGQRLDALQQTVEARVKAATEAVQAATQASRTAAEAGQAQAAEATKAVDRRLQEQADKIAALDKSVSQRADTATVQAALRVVVADRVASALESGTSYAEPLATLRKLDPATEAQAKALAPFADKGAPTAAQLADDFRPIAERIAAKRRAQQAKANAGSGDFRSKLLSMADGLVQVRKADAPAPEAADQPEGKVQAALNRGDLTGAEAAFAALPAEARDEAGDFGATLKARAEAEAAARTLIGNAFQALPTGAGSATPASAPSASPSR